MEIITEKINGSPAIFGEQNIYPVILSEQDIYKKIYNRLFNHFGPQYWWPGDTPFEVIIGAILTQNTAWKNVSLVINNLKMEGVLNPNILYNMPFEELAAYIRPTGFYRLKTERLKAFMEFFYSVYYGDIDEMFKEDLFILRKKMLNVRGIGYETADSILLYAGNKPIFVVDAYTKRISLRHNLITQKADYEEIQRLFMDNLSQDYKLFNEYHALIVQLGKRYCRPKPDCIHCPLFPLL